MVRFGILGPLEVTTERAVITIPGAKQRAILAVLLLHPREVVSADRLLDVCWDGEQPVNPKNALQSQVSALRRLLGDGDRSLLASRIPGYVLETAPGSIDAEVFERLVTDGRAAQRSGDPAAAERLLSAALELWRGPPLPEFAGRSFADTAIARLEELRLGATEDRFECALQTGRHDELVAELESLVAAHPLRERLRGQLMLALARSGRQADALEVFHDTRRILDEELGIDPGRELLRVYETLLRQQDEAPAREARRGAVASSPTAPLAPDTLPRPISSFVGRDDDLERVVGLLDVSRLVTLTGPGGVGKTRLAIESAHAVRRQGGAEGGVWLVELAGLRDPDLLGSTVADHLGLSEGAGLPTAAPASDIRWRLEAALRTRDALLVLDNCEHLVEEAADLVRRLLEATTALTVLCTSREPLGITGETVWSVSSLGVPPAGARVPSDALDGWGAVALFMARVRDADPDLQLDRSTAPIVADICRRLDGIPLALELAAGRVRTLGLEETAARLDDRFALLAGGDRTVQPRQRTLRAVIEWSWELLDDQERTLFRRLAIFAGPSTLAAIEQVCSDDGHLPATEVPAVLTALVDKSVVTIVRAPGPRRYRLLDTLRAYATERPSDPPEREAVLDRYLRYVHTTAVELVSRLRGPRQIAAMRELDALLDDVRAALRWFEDRDDAVSGAALATDLGWYWYLRGYRSEGVRAMAAFAPGADPRAKSLTALWTAFLGPPDVVEPPENHVDEAVAALAVHGDLRDQTLGALLASVVTSAFGDRDRALGFLALAQHLAERTEDDADAALVALAAGNIDLAVGDLRGSHARLTEALGRFEEVGDRWGQVQCLTGLLTHAEVTGDLTAATEHAERGISLAQELHMTEMEAILRCRNSTIAVLAGEPDRAESEIDAAGRLAERIGSDVIAQNVNVAQGLLALRSGDLDLAEDRFGQARDWVAPSPYPAMRGYALTRLGTVAELRGDLERAERLHLESYADMRTVGDPRSMALALEGLAGAYAAGGRAEDAIVLIGAAESLRGSVGPPLSEAERVDVDRAMRAARDVLGERALAGALERGRGLPLDELPIG